MNLEEVVDPFIALLVLVYNLDNQNEVLTYNHVSTFKVIFGHKKFLENVILILRYVGLLIITRKCDSGQLSL